MQLVYLSLAFWTLYGGQIIINCIDHVMELLEQDCRYISAGAIYAARTAGVNRPRRGPRANRANKAGRDKPCSSQINANEAAERIDVYANMRWLKSWQRAAEGREEEQGEGEEVPEQRHASMSQQDSSQFRNWPGKCCTKLLTRFKTLLWHRPL